MEKKQISGLLSIIISAVIAIAALWGYNVVVVQPMAEQVAQNTVDLYGTAGQGGDRAVGDTNLTNLVTAGDVTVGGALAVVGAITGGSFSPATFSSATDLYANTGAFTTTLKLAGTPVARTRGDAIDASSLKVALTPVALLQGSAIDASSLKVALTPVALLQGSAVDASSLKVALTPVALQLGALAGKSLVCGSTTITGTGTLPHGLATPSFVTLGLGQDVTGDGNYLSFVNASGVVTAKAWNSALTPAPATTPVVVDWCVNGTR